MTPNMGQGGNSAIESAAALANHLGILFKSSSSGSISLLDIKSCLDSWQTARQPRASQVWTQANSLTRLEAGATLKDRMSRTLFGAERLDAVSLPSRAAQCSMPLDMQSNIDHEQTVWKRALCTAPLVGCYYSASITMGTILQKLEPLLASSFAQGTWTAINGETLDLIRPMYHIQFLDKMFAPLILCFLPSISGSDPRSHVQMISFMADIGPVYGIWLLESYRKGKSNFAILL
jgi:hypothetical protein